MKIVGMLCLRGSILFTALPPRFASYERIKCMPWAYCQDLPLMCLPSQKARLIA